MDHVGDDGPVARIGSAAVGVLGYVRANGQPNAAAVTPYAVDGRLVVTSTLALVDKAAALRRDPRVTLTAAGVTVRGRAQVEVDTTPVFFDRHLRTQELAKYPPSQLLLRVPGHRCLLPWYVGRVVVWIEPEAAEVQAVNGDRATLTVLDGDGRLTTTAIDEPADLGLDRLPVVPRVPEGRGVLLVHDEGPSMRTLRQLALHGRVVDGALHVHGRRGALDAPSLGPVEQVRELRALRRRARANRARLASWPAVGSARVR